VLRLKADPTLGTGQIGRVLVPGCGFGWDALALAEAGWDVVALDIVDELKDSVGTRFLNTGAKLLIADFFAHKPAKKYDLVFDHTFFCALPLKLRAKWGKTVAKLCAPSARVVSLVFPENRPTEEGGPPYGMCALAVENALGDAYELIEDSNAAPSQGRWWPERWAQFGYIAQLL